MRSTAVKKGAKHPYAKYFFCKMTMLYLWKTHDCYQSLTYFEDGQLQSSRPSAPFVFDLMVN